MASEADHQSLLEHAVSLPASVGGPGRVVPCVVVTESSGLPASGRSRVEGHGMPARARWLHLLRRRPPFERRRAHEVVYQSVEEDDGSCTSNSAYGKLSKATVSHMGVHTL